MPESIGSVVLTPISHVGLQHKVRVDYKIKFKQWEIINKLPFNLTVFIVEQEEDKDNFYITGDNKLMLTRKFGDGVSDYVHKNGVDSFDIIPTKIDHEDFRNVTFDLKIDNVPPNELYAILFAQPICRGMAKSSGTKMVNPF